MVPFSAIQSTVICLPVALVAIARLGPYSSAYTSLFQMEAPGGPLQHHPVSETDRDGDHNGDSSVLGHLIEPGEEALRPDA